MISHSVLRKFVVQCSTKVSKGIIETLFQTDMHYNCRNAVYPGSSVERFFVPDDKVDWKEKYDGYNPPSFTHVSVFGKPWADPEIGKPGFNPDWNSDKGEINRLCGNLKYEIDIEGYPINPVGRTGLKGRGLLGRWGSNCAGDCIVTRWKRGARSTEIIRDEKSGKGLIEFLAIKRKDCGEWAIPGGFADKSEHFLDTIKREFFEEALNKNHGHMDLVSGQRGGADKLENTELGRKNLNEIFKNYTFVYSGYVDDRRNTDQAWISTNAINVHDDKGDLFNDITFEAGDDAADVKWMDVNNSMKLYASHKSFLQITAEKLGAEF